MDQQVVTTLVSHEPKSVQGRNGQFTIHIFRDANGAEYSTSKAEIANKTFALLNQQLTVLFETNTNAKGYTNSYIKDVAAGATTIATAPSAPTAPGGAPTASAPSGGGGGGVSPEREVKIMRQSALERAILAHSAGIAKLENLGQLIRLSEKFVEYFTGGAAAVMAGTASTATQDVGDSSTGSADAGATPVAPASSPTSMTPPGPSNVVADDGVPF